MTPLQIAYLIDIVVSLPVALVTLMGKETAAKRFFAANLPPDPSVRIALGAMWMAIVLCSVAGLGFPVAMSPVLVLQVIYKSLWLALFAVPRWLSGRRSEVPWRIAGTFLAFVFVYPWVIPWDTLFAFGQ